MQHTISSMSLREAALHALCICAPAEKSNAVISYYTQTAFQQIPSGAELSIAPSASAPMPGRPDLPRLLPPKDVPRRSPNTLQGRAALIHALTHIEFNAINLALDAVWRFPDMPEPYYRDWWQVAYEEVLHFNLMRKHLEQLGYHYGDFDAHGGLWNMVEKTSTDLCARMALIPRTMEARGLDVTPGIQEKLRQVGDHNAVAILDIIIRDEIGHVTFGNRWYHWLCEQQGVDPQTHYASLLEQYHAPRIKPPLNEAARHKAGFTAQELVALNTTS